MSRSVPPKLLKRIRALVLDVDGVLTDGGMYYGPGGEGLKRFNVKDGMGLRLVLEAGIAVALISGEASEILRRRAEKLQIADVFIGVEDKLKTMEGFLAARKVAVEDAAYVGDDVNDLPPMSKVGLPVAVADAAPQVRKAARWITTRRGGDAAVREVCDAILAARGP
jgi:3-deoxy-D-manno-octulosonate 8-phosphate phosphatase (KDO 8-P phosphatase)